MATRAFGSAKRVFLRCGAFGRLRFQRAQLLVDESTTAPDYKRLSALKKAETLMEKEISEISDKPKKKDLVLNEARRLSEIHGQIVNIYKKLGDHENTIVFLQKKIHAHRTCLDMLEKDESKIPILKEKEMVVQAYTEITRLYDQISDENRTKDPNLSVAALEEKSVIHAYCARELISMGQDESALQEFIKAAESSVKKNSYPS